MFCRLGLRLLLLVKCQPVALRRTLGDLNYEGYPLNSRLAQDIPRAMAEHNIESALIYASDEYEWTTSFFENENVKIFRHS